MDPFFFLTKDKNFIPHEYPCRTDFAAERRGKRARTAPTVFDADARSGCRSARRGSISPASGSARRASLPGPRTVIAPSAGTRPRACASRTCGGAILVVNGREVGWMAPYQRNLEAMRSRRRAARGRPERDPGLVRRSRRARRPLLLPARLPRGRGGPVRRRCPRLSRASAPARSRRRSDGMHFEAPSYVGGEVTLAILLETAADPGSRRRMSRCEGDFMSTEETVRSRPSPAGRADARLLDRRHRPISRPISAIST